MGRPRGSSGSWRQRQEKDPYVQQARRQGLRSRAVFKLEELLETENLLKPGMTCVDLGAAPGGWSQLLARRMGGRGRVIAVDLLPMEPLPGVDLVQGDFDDEAVLNSVLALTGGRAVDLVFSDMAPNMSGNRAIDQPRAMHLAELALAFARDVLRPGGGFICKLFQGEGSDRFVLDARTVFERVRVRKPRASRPGSSETYLVARNYQL